MTEQTSTIEEKVETTETAPVETKVETQAPVTQQEPVETTKSEPMNVSTVGITKEEVKEGVPEADFGSNLNDLVTRALKEGITQEEQDQLEASGMADNFKMIIEGHQAKQRDTDREIQGIAGGEKEYGELIEFAKANFNDAEVASFNKAVLESGDLGLAKLAVEGLKARYTAQNGQDPQVVVQAGGAAVTSSNTFDTVNDYINETRSMEYRTNPEHAAEVEARRNRSGF